MNAELLCPDQEISIGEQVTFGQENYLELLTSHYQL